MTLEAAAWLLVLAFLAYRISPQVKAAFGVGAGDTLAPEFQLQTLDQEPVSLASLQGKVVLVNFWATWCPPCRIEMPGFQRVYEENRDDGLVVLGISTDRAGEAVVREFLTDRGLTFPVAMANAEVVRSFGDVRTLPTSFLIDRSGRVVQEVRGIFAEPALRMAVNRLLAEPVPAPMGGER
jgi:cytochrome c biogenesis protein CcmG, thiol:disulfide interchange protein DsbE